MELLETKEVQVTVNDREQFTNMLTGASEFVKKGDASLDLAHIFLKLQKTVPSIANNQVTQVPGNGLFVIGSDGTLSIIQGHAAVGNNGIIHSTDEFELLVPSSFADLISKLPKKHQIKFVLSEHKLTITSGKNVYEVMTQSAKDYTMISLQDMTAITVESKRLCTALKYASLYVETKQETSVLRGVHIGSTKEGIVVEACDRIQYYREFLSTEATNLNLLLSRETIQKIISQFEKQDIQLTFGFGDSGIKVSGEGTTIISKQLDGSYPDIGKLTPQSVGHFIMNTSDLNDTLTRLILYSQTKNKSSHTVIMNIHASKGEVHFDVASEMGKSLEIIEAKECSTDMRMGIDPKRTKDAIKPFLDYEEIRIEYQSPISPFRIEPADEELKKHYAVVQAVRLYDI